MSVEDRGRLSAEDERLVERGVPIGLHVDVDYVISLAEITATVVEDCVGSHADSITVDDKIVFWFSGVGQWPGMNSMAVLFLLDATTLRARHVPLLWGPVLITGAGPDGQPRGLSEEQFSALGDSPPITRPAQIVLDWREYRQRRARRR